MLGKFHSRFILVILIGDNHGEGIGVVAGVEWNVLIHITAQRCQGDSLAVVHDFVNRNLVAGESLVESQIDGFVFSIFSIFLLDMHCHRYAGATIIVVGNQAIHKRFGFTTVEIADIGVFFTIYQHHIIGNVNAHSHVLRLAIFGVLEQHLKVERTLFLQTIARNACHRVVSHLKIWGIKRTSAHRNILWVGTKAIRFIHHHLKLHLAVGGVDACSHRNRHIHRATLLDYIK